MILIKYSIYCLMIGPSYFNHNGLVIRMVKMCMLELKYRVEKISKIKRVEDELFLLIFSTRSLTNL